MIAALVKIDVAAARLGWSAAKLFDLVDGGTLIERGFVWVWNLANDPTGIKRDLRFWWPEIDARASLDTSKHRKFSSYELEWVINKILPPSRTNFHAGEVDELFQIRPRTRIDLHDEIRGTKLSGRNSYTRDILAAFLERRWLHHQRDAGPHLKEFRQLKHRPAVYSRGNAVLAGSNDPELAALPAFSPAAGRGNVHTSQSILPHADNGRCGTHISPDKAPTLHPTSRTAASATVNRPGRSTNKLSPANSFNGQCGHAPSLKTATHAPASPATTPQNRSTSNSTAPASLPGAVNFAGGAA